MRLGVGSEDLRLGVEVESDVARRREARDRGFAAVKLC